MGMSCDRSRNQLILKYPASWWGNLWREALPSGNGKIGAAVYGGVKDETILINHADLWHWGRKDPLPDVSDTLPEVRRMMSEGQFLDASWLLANTLKEKGYSTRLASKLPLGSLKVGMACRKGFKKYRRSLDMETGEVTVQWMDGEALYKRKLFVSRADDMMVYEITCSEALIDAGFSMAMHQGEDSHTKTKLEEVGETLEIKAEGSLIYYAARNDDGTDFGAVLRLLPSEGSLVTGESAIHVTDTRKILVLLKAFAGGDRTAEWKKFGEELAAVDQSYEELLASHVQRHKALFNAASIYLFDGEDLRSNEELLLESYEGETPTSLVEKMWAYGRYLFISATREDGQPCSMYGLWGGGYRLMWCHNMANENIQMIYWHVLAGGLTELMPAFFTYYEKLMGDFRENARKLYGCRGIYVPAGSTPGIGLPNQIVPVIMNWTSAAGWLAHHFYNYYLYTGDAEFLQSKALPFMREVALFYEDFLVIGEDEHYLYYPSVSPENTPENFMPKDRNKQLSHPMPTAINATMDFAIMKELLGNLIEGSKTVGADPADIGKWEEMRSRIPPYQVNEEGAVREWMHPLFDDRYDHRHLSHIYPVFPGQEINGEDHPELLKAFETAVRKRLLGAQSGWSLTHMACIYARFGDGNSALECLELLSRSCLINNFYTLHNDWRNMGIAMNIQSAPIQLDANMGWVNAVQEMLLYSSPKLIKLLPACPEKWRKGNVRDLRFCTGRVTFAWDVDAGTLMAELYADRATDVMVKLPGQFSGYAWEGKEVSVSPVDGREDYARVCIPQGGRLYIAAGGR